MASPTAAKQIRLQEENKGDNDDIDPTQLLQVCHVYEDEEVDKEFHRDEDGTLKTLGYQEPPTPAGLSPDACIAVYESDKFEARDQIFYERYEFAPVRIFFHAPKGFLGFKCRLLGRVITLDMPTTRQLLNFLERKLSPGSGYVEWAKYSKPSFYSHLNTFVIARTEHLVLQ